MHGCAFVSTGRVSSVKDAHHPGFNFVYSIIYFLGVFSTLDVHPSFHIPNSSLMNY